VWAQRIHNMKEANRRKREQREAQEPARARAKAQREAAKAAALQEKERAKAQREAAKAAERRQQEQAKAQRQAAAQQAKLDAVHPRQSAEQSRREAASAQGSVRFAAAERKVAPAPGQPWDAKLTDKEVKKSAGRLNKVIPPPPIPAEEVKLNWKKVYLNDDRLASTADWVVAGWEITGVLGENIAFPCKVLMIGGKSFIAGEDGAYEYLTKKDEVFDAALRYTKNPAQAMLFAHVVDKVRKNEPLPPGTDPGMVKAARAIADPKLASTSSMVWDAMTSKQALMAMATKATIEVGADLLAPTSKRLFNEEAGRKAMYDAVRVERTLARKNMEAAGSETLKAQWGAVVHRSDVLSSNLYSLEKATHVVNGLYDEKITGTMGELGDAIAERYLAPKPEVRTY